MKVISWVSLVRRHVLWWKSLGTCCKSTKIQEEKSFNLHNEAF